MKKHTIYHDGPVGLAFAKSTSLPTLRAAYSDRTAALMAALCQDAYIPFETLTKRRKRGVALKMLPQGEAQLTEELAKGGFTLAKLFNVDDVQAYLALRSDIAVLAFRGTVTFRDWCTDLNEGLVMLPDYKGLRIHGGFWKAFQTAHQDIEATVNAQVPPTLPLYVTGHSMGGALAQITAMVLERDNLAACYTFGSPRVATVNFDRDVKCPHYRVIDGWDLVPGVPPPFGRYRHSGDPRLLAPKTHPQEALRRDRLVLASFWVNVWAMLVSVISRRLSIIDDHMIWNYRRQLDPIARARNGGHGGVTPPGRGAG